MTFGYIGMCAFPCGLQGKSLVPVIGGIFQSGSVIGEYGSEDPSILTFTFTNQSISKQEIWECYARSGPFFAYRRKLNETYVEYRCEKRPLVPINSDGVIRVVFGSQWEHFAEPLTICDVCNGKLTVSPVIKVSQLSSVQNSSEDTSKQTTKSSVNTVSNMSNSNTYHEDIQPQNNYSDDQTVLKTCEPVTQLETTEFNQESISKNSKTGDNNNMNIKSMVKNNSVECDCSTPKVLSLDTEPNQQKLAMDPIRMLDNRLDILESQW
ncbi:unnamed protein product [Mytilus coruscus]|uniref:Uncharacterized protein n=1 Tax=Mytilus coruscus TaxID=42192 RepID=A0A6J8D7B0_MYTCO|nr:unnamed protein product [Mytilus coruscus]